MADAGLYAVRDREMPLSAGALRVMEGNPAAILTPIVAFNSTSEGP